MDRDYFRYEPAQAYGRSRRKKTNLFATIGPRIDGGIVLSGHSDEEAALALLIVRDDELDALRTRIERGEIQ